MRQLVEVVFLVCCFGFGWAAGSTRLYQDREHGCATVLAVVALVVAVAGLAWCYVVRSGAWSAYTSAIGALLLGGALSALKKRY